MAQVQDHTRAVRAVEKHEMTEARVLQSSETEAICLQTTLVQIFFSTHTQKCSVLFFWKHETLQKYLSFFHYEYRSRQNFSSVLLILL